MPVMERRQGPVGGPFLVLKSLCPDPQVSERGALEARSQLRLWQICLRRQYRHQMERKGELGGRGRGSETKLGGTTLSPPNLLF